ncbi:orotate phosphoribosyltransferase [Alteribacillus persepolensis]|uniref:Orotate phosphoribosyltransferase n=1 Tax=Alteribacillus persepolensis TaxID=568899 RepID=A0A1G7YHJ2_9BACI|nr:orotate phosphoribosyltransferase [Alteribacillus persepolensis]SDG96018.1 orotate phosphoribosyltransferase [Alteribacillus persepolensis]
MKQAIAEELLKIKAVSLQPDDPFTWSSGILSPIYCDNRLTLSYPSLRQSIANELQTLIEKQYPDVEVVAGTATAGIPHAALVADKMNVPMIYVRGSSKSHGKGNQIEGVVKENQKVVIVEDLISTGGSVIGVQKALQQAGADVLGTAAIFTYGLERGKENLQAANLKTETLTDYEALIQAALSKNFVTTEQYERLEMWKKDPENWLQAL